MLACFSPTFRVPLLRIKSVVPWLFRSEDPPGFRQEKKRVQQILVECLDYDIPRLDWGSGVTCAVNRC